jgi:hypothetical protein
VSGGNIWKYLAYREICGWRELLLLLLLFTHFAIPAHSTAVTKPHSIQWNLQYALFSKMLFCQSGRINIVVARIY